VPAHPYADVDVHARCAALVIPAGSTNALVLRSPRPEHGSRRSLSKGARLIAVDIGKRAQCLPSPTQSDIGAETSTSRSRTGAADRPAATARIPTMAVTGVGAEMKRDERYFALADAHQPPSSARTNVKSILHRGRLPARPSPAARCRRHRPAEAVPRSTRCHGGTNGDSTRRGGVIWDATLPVRRPGGDDPGRWGAVVHKKEKPEKGSSSTSSSQAGMCPRSRLAASS